MPKKLRFWVNKLTIATNQSAKPKFRHVVERQKEILQTKPEGLRFKCSWDTPIHQTKLPSKTSQGRHEPETSKMMSCEEMWGSCDDQDWSIRSNCLRRNKRHKQEDKIDQMKAMLFDKSFFCASCESCCEWWQEKTCRTERKAKKRKVPLKTKPFVCWGAKKTNTKSAEVANQNKKNWLTNGRCQADAIENLNVKNNKRNRLIAAGPSKRQGVA